jgi:hypothetical protein
MTGIVIYVIMASLGLSLFYLAYLLIFRNDTNFRQARLYLLSAMILSLIIPASNIRVNTALHYKPHSSDVSYVMIPGSRAIEANVPFAGTKTGIWEWFKQQREHLLTVALFIYVFVTTVLLMRILLQLIAITMRYIQSEKIKDEEFILLYHQRRGNTFSFFRWIFVNKEESDNALQQMIIHEKIHARQVHSLDIMLIELLSAVMWFNPLISRMKNSVQLVHEYLADKGAIDTGIDRIAYQALLINQVSEDKLICLSSSFNNALIKKRMIMMTKTGIKKGIRLKLLSILPVSAIILLFMAVCNGLNSMDTQPKELQPLLKVTDIGELPNDADVLPPDTIIKRTVIKKVYKDHPGDTIVEESEEIIVGDENVDHVSTIRYDSNLKNGRISHMETEEHITKEHKGDSVRVYKVISTGDAKNEEFFSDKKIVIRHSGNQESTRILWVIDGVTYKEKDALEKINPDDVVEMNVLKSDEMISKYTSEEYDGVIIVTTKAGKRK